MQKSNPSHLTKDSCSICSKKFNGMFVSEHQCKRCLRYVCKECCSKKKQFFTNNLNNHVNSKTGTLKAEEHRACDKCLQSTEKLNNYAKINQLNFNTLSKIGKQWGQIIEIDKADVVNQTEKLKKGNIQATTNRILQIWSQCNQSFRQILGLSLSKTSISQANELIKNFLSKSCYGDDSGHLAAFILCHCDQKSGLEIYEYLSSLKSSISIENVTQYVTLLCQNSKQFSGDSKIMKNLLQFTHKFGINLLETQTFFLKLLPVDIVSQFIHEVLLSGSSTVLELIISYVIFQYRDLILNQKVNHEEIRGFICQSISSQKVDKGIKIIRKLITKKSFQGAKKSQVKNNLLSPEPEINQIQQKSEKVEEIQNDGLLHKINEASQFLRKIEENQIAEEDIDTEQMANLEKYLDLVINQNEQSLEQIDNLDGILSGIEDQLYKTNNI